MCEHIILEPSKIVDPTTLKTRFQCQNCPKNYIDRRSALVHIKDHKCNCGNVKEMVKVEGPAAAYALRAFNARKALKTIKCKECPKKFSTRTTLKRHLLSHKKICECVKREPLKIFDTTIYKTKFQCQNCPKVYIDRRDFYAHVKDHECNCGNVKVMAEVPVPAEESAIVPDANNIYNCKECGTSLASIHALKRHLLMHKEMCEHIILEPVEILDQTTFEKKFQCQNCPKVYRDKTSMIAHIKEHECDCGNVKILVKPTPLKPPYTCQDCSITYATSSALKRHLLSHKELCEHVNQEPLVIVDPTTFKSKFQCQNCPKVYRDRQDLKTHIIKEHECNCGNIKVNIKDEAPAAKALAAIKALAKGPPDPNPPIRSYDCKDCPKKFLTPGSLWRHSFNHKSVCEHIIKEPLEIIDPTTNMKALKCQNCSKVMNNRQDMTRHLQRHKCDCDNGIKNTKQGGINDLPDEFKPVLDENNRLICPKCPTKSLKDDITYVRHVRVLHLLPKPECPICFEIFSCQKYLRKHIARHRKPTEKQECPICGQMFMDVKTHIRNIHGEQRFQCTGCPKRFATKGNLTSHYKESHLKLRRRSALCTVCGKICITKSNLVQHMMVHTNEKPYNCDVCYKSFANNYKVVIHRMIHTGERPYPCDYCDMAFRSKSLKIKHIKRKHTDKPYKCEQCGEDFRTLLLMNNHIVKMHQVNDDNVVVQVIDQGIVD